MKLDRNGLNKFEPNDLNKALMVDIKQIKETEQNKILQLYDAYRQKELDKQPNEHILEEMNSIFMSVIE